jgi:hypothetical protein
MMKKIALFHWWSFTAGCRPSFANGVGPDISQLRGLKRKLCYCLVIVSLAMRRRRVDDDFVHSELSQTSMIMYLKSGLKLE